MNKPILSGRGNLLNSVTGFLVSRGQKLKVAITPQKGIRLIFLSQLWISLWWRARSRVRELLQEQAWRHKPTLELQSSLYEKLSFLSNLSRRTFPGNILCVSKRGERDVRRTLKVNHLEKGSEIKNDSPTIKESIKMGD